MPSTRRSVLPSFLRSSKSKEGATEGKVVDHTVNVGDPVWVHAKVPKPKPGDAAPLLDEPYLLGEVVNAAADGSASIKASSGEVVVVKAGGVLPREATTTPDMVELLRAPPQPHLCCAATAARQRGRPSRACDHAVCRSPHRAAPTSFRSQT